MLRVVFYEFKVELGNEFLVYDRFMYAIVINVFVYVIRNGILKAKEK